VIVNKHTRCSDTRMVPLFIDYNLYS